MFMNWVRETTTSPGGTSAITLTAMTGFPRFSQAFADQKEVSYAILTNDNPPQPLEWGIGIITVSTNSLARTKILGTYASGTLNTTNPTAVNLTNGTVYNVINTASEGFLTPGLHGFDATTGSSGGFAPYPWVNSTAAGAYVATADRMLLIPFRLSTPRKLTAVKMRVSVLAAGGNCMMGIFQLNNDGTAGAALATSAQISVATAGVITWTLTTAQIFPPGWYYFSVACQGVTPTFNLFGNSSGTMPTETPVNTDSSFVQCVVMKHVALTSGWSSLPSPPSSGGTVVAETNIPPAFALVTG